jgi:putative FmdB family regulatory protein
VPTYQYACTACGHRLEAVQSFSEESLTECPACAGRLRKLFSAVGIVFKGSGFYRTDSRAGSTIAASKAETPAPASDTTSATKEVTTTTPVKSSKDSGSAGSTGSSARRGTPAAAGAATA